MSCVEVPACSAEWKRQVEADHTPAETAHAERAGIDLNTYRREASKRVCELLLDKRMQVRMRHDGLEGFMTDGFYRNSFDGGTSAGVRSLELRVEVEATVLGLRQSAAASERPIYGYLQGTDEAHNALNAYGSVLLVLAEELIDRATIVFGDSIGSTFQGGNATFAPTPVGDPTLLCTFASADLYSVNNLAEAVDPGYPYAELQIYGGLRPRDISFVTFCGNRAPDQTTMMNLEREEIRYDVIEGYPA